MELRYATRLSVALKRGSRIVVSCVALDVLPRKVEHEVATLDELAKGL